MSLYSLIAQSVEQSAVNRSVAGSSPAQGARKNEPPSQWRLFFYTKSAKWSALWSESNRCRIAIILFSGVWFGFIGERRITMGLDARLAAVASLVPCGARVADVGTDHAYLAITLVREKDAELVIATDKNEGPCAAARRTISEAGLSERVPVRCGDGFAVLSPGEVDTVCIAGMGGGLMTAILAAYPAVTSSLSHLVLQPMNDSAILRRWLYENGWYISREKLALEDDRMYEILEARQGKERMPERWLLTIGPVLWQEKPRLFERHAKFQMNRLSRILQGMKKSVKARESDDFRELEAELRDMEKHLKKGE